MKRKLYMYIFIFMQFIYFLYIFYIYDINLDYRRVWYPILRKQNISFVLIYETIKIIPESVFKDNRLDINTVLNFWQYTVLHRGGNDLVRWIFMVVRHSSCNALQGTIVLLRREPLKYCLAVYFMKVGDFASLRRGATPF